MPETRRLVLVTGSSGFVGSAVVAALVERYDVVALDLEASKHPSPSVEFIALDVTSDDSVDAALKRVRHAHGATIASVIHLAAFIDLGNAPDPRYDTITVDGTRRLLAALQSFEVGQFVFMSTMLVQAPSGHGRRIDESGALDDRFAYRASKIRTERVLRDGHGSIPVVILRAAGVYDERCHAAFLAQQIARIYERRLTGHVYPGDLSAGQPYLHIDDLIDAMQRAIERRDALDPVCTLLLGESDVMGYDEIQQAIGMELHGEPWTTTPIPRAVASSGAWMQSAVFDEDPFVRPWMVEIASDHYELDTSRAAGTLGWHPQHGLRSTLPAMLSALKADPVGWYEDNRLDAAVVAGRTEPAAPKDAGGETMDMGDDHAATLWAHWLAMLLGAWLAASPFAFGSFDATAFSDTVRQVTADRHLADPALRSLLLARSDVVSGVLVMLFGTLSLSKRHAWAQWANAATGTWLLFAPLVFWAPSAAVYANDTFIGALVIAFAVLVPMMPGMATAGMTDRSDRPPGWSYSPSSWLQRIPIIALGAFGFLVSRVLAAYQLGHIDTVWDPFFHGVDGLNGSETVITSSVSRAWPVPDAALGGVAYLFEVLMGAMGDGRRWRTMPWMVAMFGIVVVPLGVVSIAFIVIQPIVIGTWCALCLVTAAAMLAMIPLALDELVATGQYLVQSYRRGEPFWSTFFRGGADPLAGLDESAGFDAALKASTASAVRGVTLPPRLVACVLIGAGLMFTRVLFGTVPPLADSDHVTGAMIVTFSVIAMAEVARPVRFFNVAFGLWLIAAPWWMNGGGSSGAAWTETVAGVAVVGLSLSRGRLGGAHYGSWDRFVW